MFWPFFYLDDFLDCFLVEHVTTNTVTGVGGIAHGRTSFKLLDNLIDEALLGVVRIDCNHVESVRIPFEGE